MASDLAMPLGNPGVMTETTSDREARRRRLQQDFDRTKAMPDTDSTASLLLDLVDTCLGEPCGFPLDPLLERAEQIAKPQGEVQDRVDLLIRIARLRARQGQRTQACLLYTSPSPRDATLSRMPSSA